MSTTNRNFIIFYVVLVGLPILAMFGVLKTGRKLAAPISVDGTWKLQADPARLTALPCGKSLAASDLTLAISQSGSNFTLSLPSGLKSVASGVLEGTSLKASVTPSGSWSNDADCGRGRELALLATVDPQSDPRSLTGTISLRDCPSCSPVVFRAFRLPPAKVGH